MIESYCMITFSDAHGAIRAERLLSGAGLYAGIMPLPAKFSAGCGFALYVKPQELNQARSIANEAGVNISSCYRVEKNGIRKDYYKIED